MVAVRRTPGAVVGRANVTDVLGFALPQFGAAAHADAGDLARFASTAEGLGAESVHTHVRINVAEGTTIKQVGEAVRVLADNDYPDAFVDLMYVETGTDAALDWVERLLAR